jgi:hypothetical protein
MRDKEINRNKLYIFSSEMIFDETNIVVIGDLHGDYQSLKKISKLFNPKKDLVIFLGDYADRGDSGLEVIKFVYSLIEHYPERIIALKGNHEDYTDDGVPKFSPSTLIQEVEGKIGNWNKYFKGQLKPFIFKLYLAAIIPGKILFVHGGISSKILNIDTLRFPSYEVEKDLLWSDPVESEGEYPNLRGAGVEFGPDVTDKIFSILKVRMIFRSHQPQKTIFGPYSEHKGKVITISSTSAYGTKPFILKFAYENLLQTLEKPLDCTVYLE